MCNCLRIKNSRERDRGHKKESGFAGFSAPERGCVSSHLPWRVVRIPQRVFIV